MKLSLLIASDGGPHIAVRKDGGWHTAPSPRPDLACTCAAASGGTLLVGTRSGLYRSEDAGAAWSESHAGPSLPHVRWLEVHPARAGWVYAGTEPAGIFRSEDAGETWAGAPEVEALRDHHGWWLPYSPEAGCVRGFAFEGSRGYAAVEVGGVLRTDDAGRTWALAPGSSGEPGFQEPAPGFVHADVHSVTVVAGSPEEVYAATNAGLYFSRNGGEEWQPVNRDGYTRAVWVDPADPTHIFAGPARSVGRQGTMISSEDGGGTWNPPMEGLGTPWPATMVERFFSPGSGILLALLDDGRAVELDLKKNAWRPVFGEVPGIRAFSPVNP